MRGGCQSARAFESAVIRAKKGDEPQRSLVKASSFDLSVPKVGAEADLLGFLPEVGMLTRPHDRGSRAKK